MRSVAMFQLTEVGLTCAAIVASGWAGSATSRLLSHPSARGSVACLSGYAIGVISSAVGSAYFLTHLVPGTPFDPTQLSLQWFALVGGSASSAVLGALAPSLFTRMPVRTAVVGALAGVVGCLVAMRLPVWLAGGICGNSLDQGFLAALR